MLWKNQGYNIVREIDAVTIEELSKSFKIGFFKTKQALNNLNLAIHDNEIFGYLGANGAGKTTTFKLMLGLLFPDKGSVRFWGTSFLDAKARAQVGYLPENPYFYSYLTALESLNFSASMYDMSSKLRKNRVSQMLELVNLTHAANVPIRKFSRGMMQRLGIAQALVHDPKLLILDEPMSGLDPMGRKDMRNIILNCRDEGKTILFSTHIISDVETVCDRACILANGELKKTVTINDMLHRQGKSWEITYKGTLIDIVDFKANHIDIQIEALSGKDLHVIKINDYKTAHHLISVLAAKKEEIISFTPQRQSLEEIYVKNIR